MSRFTINMRGPAGIGGRILGSLFFLVFLGMGLLFCFFVGREFYLNAQCRGWQRAECVILESGVQEEKSSETPYAFAVRYEYQWQGRTHSSDKWSRQRATFSDFSRAQALADTYKPDTKATCYVNPSNPSEAVFQRPTLWIGMVILLPLVFVAIGMIGVAAMWTKSPTAVQGDVADVVRKSISSRGSRQLGAKAGVAFFALFFVMGTVIFYFLTLRPLLGVLAARDWVPTPCTVVSSRVQTHRGDDSTTYRIDILYSYEFDGREHRSNRYHFMGGSSSGYKGKAEAVRQYPAGAKRTCYVDARNPNEAVLERGLTRDMWFGAIPAVFMLIGAGGVIGVLRKGRKSASDVSALEPAPIREIIGVTPMPFASAEVFEETPGSRVLKSSSSRLVGVVVLAVFAAIWNGGIFFGFIRGSGFFRRGHGSFFDWFTTLFMLPFIAVGLVVIGVLIYQVLTLFNPKVEASIQPGTPRLGGSLDLNWRLAGRTDVLRGLRIFLEGREEATYRRGTTTSTDRKPFLKLDLAATTSPAEMAAGQARIRMPLDTVPSFKSDNNKIVWAIKVEGDIARWPDLREEFMIEVAQAPSRADVPQASRLPERTATGTVAGTAASGTTAPQRDDLKLLLRDERRNFLGGETVEGVAGWRLEKPPKSVEVRLFWFTRGKGTEDVGVVSRVRFDAPQHEEGRKFSFALPAEPWSFSGQLISVIWALELVAEPGGHTARVELMVSPTGQEILLHHNAGA